MTHQKSVVVDGRLQGMGLDLACKVEGTLAGPSTLTVFQMTIESITGVPADLPEGIYQLEYEGSAERVRKTGDQWNVV
jgi:hypothetical protein